MAHHRLAGALPEAHPRLWAPADQQQGAHPSHQYSLAATPSVV